MAERDRAFLKRVLKHAADVVKTRTVPPESIEHWAERIASVEGEVRAPMEEGARSARSAAEMEANKASNMMEHREEIYSRPARSWFQTEAQRKQTREAAPRVAASAAAADAAADADAAGNLRKRKDHLAGADSGDKGKVKRDKYAGKTRKQRRAERDAMFAKEAKKAAGGDADGGAAPHSIAPNQKAIARGARRRRRCSPSASGVRRTLRWRCTRAASSRNLDWTTTRRRKHRRRSVPRRPTRRLRSSRIKRSARRSARRSPRR